MIGVPKDSNTPSLRARLGSHCEMGGTIAHVEVVWLYVDMMSARMFFQWVIPHAFLPGLVCKLEILLGLLAK